MVFGEVISTIGAAQLPENVELALVDPVPDPIKAHVNGLGSFLLYGSSVAGCKWPSSFSTVQIGQTAWALRNKAPNLALAALDTTCFMI